MRGVESSTSQHKPSRRWLVFAVVGAAAVVLIGVAGARFVVQRASQPHERPVPAAERSVAEPKPETRAEASASASPAVQSSGVEVPAEGPEAGVAAARTREIRSAKPPARGAPAAAKTPEPAKGGKSVDPLAEP
jgi:hypothetical protein